MKRVFDKKHVLAPDLERFLDVHFPAGHDDYDEIGVVENVDGRGFEVWAAKGDARVSAGFTRAEFFAHQQIDGLRDTMKHQLAAKE